MKKGDLNEEIRCLLEKYHVLFNISFLEPVYYYTVGYPKGIFE
ncbi:hypothetical protein SAMN05660206_102414 [Sphingobacterium wenxiniae]|uniref:Uncharacterized protein n=1 Tax=Sphingobacterium wenxiniae TaxID=683125 RepID=A0A1I6QLX8_9SPHI|nr:hypothetical protein SAMN05660206_102414 [Sphingobacterium wenxiniae]